MNIKCLRPTASEIEIWGVTLLFIPFLSLLIATTSFFMEGGLGTWMFPAAAILSFAIGHALVTRYINAAGSLLRYYLYTVISLAFALLSATLLYDNSFDGNTYHQGGIVDMIMGCNPIYNPQVFISLWSRHYAKGLEIAAATITLCFNRIECGKAVNILIIQGSIFVTYSFLRREFYTLTSRRTLLHTILLTLCPVVIRQAYIYYTDFALYSFMLLVAISLISIYRHNNPLSWCILIISALYGTSTKFTAAFYIFLTIGVGIIWCFVKGRHILSYRMTALSIALFVVAFGILGYHPYATNTIGWDNPFYPLIGGDIDIMSDNTPDIYLNGNRFSNWFRSLFYNAQGTGLWIPIIGDSLHDYYVSHEARIAGLGPFFGYVLFATMLFAAYCIAKERQYHTLNKAQASTFAGISMLLIGACFIFEHSWWLRYIPFLWAVPVILLLYTEHNNSLSTPMRTLRTVLYTLLVATQLLCCATTIVAGGAYTQRMRGLFDAITPGSTVMVYHLIESPSFEYKLQEREIKYEVVETDLESDTTLHRVHIPDNANVYVDSETYMRMQHPDLLDFIGGKK